MKLNLILTCGPQGAGKSTWAEKYASENPDVLCLSTDKLRAEMGYGAADQSVTGVVFSKMRRMTESALRKGQSVLIDATFIRKAWRKDYVALGKRLNATTIAHVFLASKEVLLERVKQRAENGGLNVPEDVISKYVRDFECPTKDEFDEVVVHGTLQYVGGI